MRTILAAGVFLAAAAFAPAASAGEPTICQPNPLNHRHPASVQVANTAVDLGAPAPASATNPLMQGFMEIRPAAVSAPEAVTVPVNPLTHQP